MVTEPPSGTAAQGEGAAAALAAAERALAAGDAAAARRVLAGVDVALAPDPVIVRRQTLLARALLAEGRAPEAVAALGVLDDLTGVAGAERAEALLVRAQAREAGGDRLGAIRDRALAHGQLTPQSASANRAALLALLRSTPQDALRAALAQAGGGVYGSWLELGLALQAAPAERPARLATWRARYPNHPAADALAQAPGFLPKAAPPGPIHGPVAVLLPLSGALAEVAGAVQEGLVEAHLDARERRVALRFYDAAREPGAVYDAALAQGAQAVIGPLRKEAAAELARRAALPVPTLALNAPEGGGRAANLYVLSLDPLDEVRAAQQHAWEAGARRAALLYPNDAWGERLLVMMRDAWRARGGVVLAVQGYDPQARDYGPAVAALLGIEDGERRHRELTRVLGTPLAYQPGPRQDLDVVLLAASAAQARLIEPQLRYHGAGRVPVYATAQVWEGGDPARNLDLEGVTFCDAPLALAASGGPGARLRALGADAYAALTRLPELMAGTPYAGASGTLRAQPDGHIARELPCARFEAGVPRVLGGAPALAQRP